MRGLLYQEHHKDEEEMWGDPRAHTAHYWVEGGDRATEKALGGGGYTLPLVMGSPSQLRQLYVSS